MPPTLLSCQGERARPTASRYAVGTHWESGDWLNPSSSCCEFDDESVGSAILPGGVAMERPDARADHLRAGPAAFVDSAGDFRDRDRKRLRKRRRELHAAVADRADGDGRGGVGWVQRGARRPARSALPHPQRLQELRQHLEVRPQQLHAHRVLRDAEGALHGGDHERGDAARAATASRLVARKPCRWNSSKAATRIIRRVSSGERVRGRLLMSFSPSVSRPSDRRARRASRGQRRRRGRR